MLAAAEGPASALRRAQNVLGTFVFGVGTVILVPVGIYYALSVALLASAQDVFRQGIGDSLSGGLIALPIWLIYLRRIARAAAAEALTTTPRPAPIAAG
jgi:hypothetical protein